MDDMQTIEIARRLAELGQSKDACKAYILAAEQNPVFKLEAAFYHLQFGEDYRLSYSWLRELYDLEEYRQDALQIMTEAFYTPNEKELRTQYEKSCRYLKRYPYLFRKDFPEFRNLPIRFYPFDDEGYLPYHPETGVFDAYWNPAQKKILHYFFKDLDNPILAEDIFSQYELEYLQDNVRASEDIGRENHIYLHYSSWEVFCAYLQILNIYPLLERKKIVFLIEDEETRYPIDFQAEYGIDYTAMPLLPPSFEEYSRIVWHTQLSSDNGGDFFNQIFDKHPNLIMLSSIMMYSVEDWLKEFKEKFKERHATPINNYGTKNEKILHWLISRFTETEISSTKGIFLMLFFSQSNLVYYDPSSRIAPVIFFQPHFHDLLCSIMLNEKRQAQITSNALESVHNSHIFDGFKYIKTFTPMRRFTTSGGAMVRTQCNKNTDNFVDTAGNLRLSIVSDAVIDRVINRTFMYNSQDRLYRDCIQVRFEDGKLNPKATFTALAAFLDLPYTESMTYCSKGEELNPADYVGSARGFDLKTVYNTYEDYLGKPERILMEYFLQDVYRYYGYDFQSYNGEDLTLQEIQTLSEQFDVMNNNIADAARTAYQGLQMFVDSHKLTERQQKELDDAPFHTPMEFSDYVLHSHAQQRKHLLPMLYSRFAFFNSNGQPLQFMPILELDPELMEAPLYH